MTTTLLQCTSPHVAVCSKSAFDSARLGSLSAAALMEWAADRFGDSLVVSTSFGIQSAVTLHLATQVNPTIPVIWVDTGYLPNETYRYAEQLTSLLNLNLHVYQSEISAARMEAMHGQLWETDRETDYQLYDDLQKVEPLQRAFKELQPLAWVSGLRSEQTGFRRTLKRVAFDGQRQKVLPILHWTSKDIYEYMQQHSLPNHPMFELGYTTVGDWHSSRPPSSDDANDRATRFRGLKEECGIHLPSRA
ncbi:MAG: phosphoadenylyl-sulfate reductase [Rubripirellula sp.]